MTGGYRIKVLANLFGKVRLASLPQRYPLYLFPVYLSRAPATEAADYGCMAFCRIVATSMLAPLLKIKPY